MITNSKTNHAKARTAKTSLALAVLLGATITYVFCLLTQDKSDQQEKVLALETRIQSLESLLAQKEDDLRRARFASYPSYNQYNAASTTPQGARLKADNHPSAQIDGQAVAVEINSSQTLKDLGTQSVNDPRSYSDKVNDYLANSPSKAKIAVVSKSLFDMAHDRENLSDYALQTIYNNQTDPDLKRVIAQVLSMRGNNALIDNQIIEAQTHLHSENPVDRQQALTNLAKTHYVNAANSIAPLLQDTDINVKLDALLAIRATGNQTHVHLVEKLLNDPDPAVSSLASDVVSNLRNLSEVARTSLSNTDIASELIPIETM